MVSTDEGKDVVLLHAVDVQTFQFPLVQGFPEAVEVSYGPAAEGFAPQPVGIHPVLGFQENDVDSVDVDDGLGLPSVGRGHWDRL